jgi:hypothetical protein
MSWAVGRCDGSEGLGETLQMDVVVRVCGVQQEMREEELWTCQHAHAAAGVDDAVMWCHVCLWTYSLLPRLPPSL